MTTVKLDLPDLVSTHTRMTVRFHAFKGDGPSFSTTDANASAQYGSLIGVRTGKQFGSASGTFSLTMKKPAGLSTKDFHSLWPDPEGVWVTVDGVRDGRVYNVLLGIIDTVAESMQRSGMGTRSETYTITGRDVGKPFELTTLFHNVYGIEALQPYHVVAKALGDTIAGVSPDVLCRKLIDAWIGNNGAAQPWELPPTLPSFTLYGLLDFRGIRAGLAGACSEPQLFSSEASGETLWSTISQYSNDVLNELWIDLGHNGGSADYNDLVPTVYLRERPFPVRGPGDKTDRSVWEALPTYELPRELINGREVTRGLGAQRYNYWSVLPGGATAMTGTTLIVQSQKAGKSGQAGQVPIYDQISIQRQGLRRYEQQSVFFAADSAAAQGDMLSLARAWTQKVHDWYAPAPFQLSGSLTLSRLMPEIRIGQRVREVGRVDKDTTYYVEGVDHAWSFPGAGQTRLTVTRGEFDGDDNLDKVYQRLARVPASISMAARAASRPDTSMVSEENPALIGVDG